MFLGLALLLSEQSEAVATWSTDKRFKDNGDKTITDTKTGLMWMKEDSYLYSGHWANWFESIQFIKKINKDGFANQYDWQLPTVRIFWPTESFLHKPMSKVITVVKVLKILP